MLGPVLERLQNELIDPLIALTFAAIDEAGLVPPPPDELQGQPLNVVLLSILAQAQKAVGVNSIDRFVAAVSSVSQVKPEVLDVFDADAWAQYYADALGVEPKLLANPQAVQALREQRAQAQQVQQQAALAQQGADVAHSLAQAQRLHRLRVRQQLRLNPQRVRVILPRCFQIVSYQQVHFDSPCRVVCGNSILHGRKAKRTDAWQPRETAKKSPAFGRGVVEV